MWGAQAPPVRPFYLCKEVGGVGGYGSGGHNKAHGMVENYERLDSFGLRRFIDDYKALSCRCHKKKTQPPADGQELRSVFGAVS